MSQQTPMVVTLKHSRKLRMIVKMILVMIAPMLSLGGFSASLANAQDLVPLELYWSPQRQDNFVTATEVGANSAKEAGYQYSRVEACVYRTQAPATVPLKLYWSEVTVEI